MRRAGSGKAACHTALIRPSSGRQDQTCGGPQFKDHVNDALCSVRSMLSGPVHGLQPSGMLLESDLVATMPLVPSHNVTVSTMSFRRCAMYCQDRACALEICYFSRDVTVSQVTATRSGCIAHSTAGILVLTWSRAKPRQFLLRPTPPVYTPSLFVLGSQPTSQMPVSRWCCGCAGC